MQRNTRRSMLILSTVSLLWFLYHDDDLVDSATNPEPAEKPVADSWEPVPYDFLDIEECRRRCLDEL